MTTTPAIWRPKTALNLVTSGLQAEPKVTQLHDGSIVFGWITDSLSTNELDWKGRILDPLGDPTSELGAFEREIRLVDTSLDEQISGDIAAKTSGGFVSAWSTFDTSAVEYSLKVTELFADGTVDSTGSAGTTTIETLSGGNGLTDVSVQVSSSSSALVAWIEAAASALPSGKDKVRFAIYDPALNAIDVPATTLFEAPTQPQVGRINDLTSTVLTNGNYVVVASVDVGTHFEVWFEIVSASGVQTFRRTVSATAVVAEDDTMPSIAALTNGNFVISWTNWDGVDSDLYFQLFDAGGTEIGSAIRVDGNTATDDKDHSAAVALDDGGFILFWDDDEPGSEGMRAQRFDASGNTVGSQVVVDDVNGIEIDAVLLEDGRVAVTWKNGEIFSAILDTRDTGSSAPFYGADGWQIGTAGNDTMTSVFGTDTLAGWDGNDDLTQGNDPVVILGGAGSDTIRVTTPIEGPFVGSPEDLFDGGPGADTIDWSAYAFGVGAVFDLGAGTAFQPGGGVEEMLNFEHLIGSPYSDSIIGSGSGNLLDGGDGDDTIDGAAGPDTLNGNQGNDSLVGGFGTDTLNGNLGNDTLVGGSDADVVNGGGGDDMAIVQSASVDSGDGGSGYDTWNMAGGFSGVTWNMRTGAGNVGPTGFTATGWEAYYDTNGNSSITGSDADNLIRGNGGEDTLRGGQGLDTIEGGTGADSLIGGADADILRGGNGNDTLDGSAGTDTIEGGDGDDLITVQGSDFLDHVDGGDGTDTLDLRQASASLVTGYLFNFTSGQVFGSNDVDTPIVTGIEVFRDSGGSNTIFADDNATGARSYDGNAGDDTIYASLNDQETLRGGAGTDLLNLSFQLGDQDVDLLTGETGTAGESFIQFEDVVAGSGDDTLKGTDGANELSGWVGNDFLLGRRGSDTLNGGFGDDTLNGGAGGVLGDTAVFSGDRSGYGFSRRTDGALIVEDIDPTNGDYGTDVLLGIETLQFADGSVDEHALARPVIGEVGSLSLDHTAHDVALQNSYVSPVVLAFVMTENGPDPVNVRVSGVTGTSITLQLQEPNYLDGSHSFETVNYAVLESGTWVLPDGSLLEAGRIDSGKLSSQGFDPVSFSANFDTAPVILSQVQTLNGPDFVTTRQQNASATGFELTMQEEEAGNAGTHTSETLGWVALEAGSGTAGDIAWIAEQATGITDATVTVPLGATVPTNAKILAGVSTFGGSDPAWARGDGNSSTSFDVSVEEDASSDAETDHSSETVDFFVFDRAGTLSAAPMEHAMEVGSTTLTHLSKTITLGRSYDNPVVVAYVATENGSDAVKVRVTDIQGDSLTMQLQEPNHLDGSHTLETVSYIVAEAGTWVLPDGTMIAAGHQDGAKLSPQGFDAVTFDVPFDVAPVILSQVQSDNGPDFVTTRQRNASDTGFEITMQEEEAGNSGVHTTETLGWIAIEQGSGSAGAIDWTAGRVSGVGDAVTTVSPPSGMGVQDVVIAGLSGFVGVDPSWVRGAGNVPGGFRVSVEEDTSLDAETAHVAELVDYIVFDGTGMISAYDHDILG